MLSLLTTLLAKPCNPHWIMSKSPLSALTREKTQTFYVFPDLKSRIFKLADSSP
jgi:hypothetical protein